MRRANMKPIRPSCTTITVVLTSGPSCRAFQKDCLKLERGKRMDTSTPAGTWYLLANASRLEPSIQFQNNTYSEQSGTKAGRRNR